MNDNQTYDVAEMASIWGVNPHTIWKSIRKGNCPFPFIKIGASIRFPREAINKMLSGEVGAAPPARRRPGRPRKSEVVAAQGGAK